MPPCRSATTVLRLHRTYWPSNWPFLLLLRCRRESRPFVRFIFRFWLSSITLFFCVFFIYVVEFSSLPTLGNSHHFSYHSFGQNPRLFVFILRRVGGVTGIMEPLPLSPSLLLLPAPSRDAVADAAKSDRSPMTTKRMRRSTSPADDTALFSCHPFLPLFALNFLIDTKIIFYSIFF